GFSPGNTVVDGLRITFGNRPAQEIRVLSTDRLLVVSAPGRPGRTSVTGSDLYGNSTILDGEAGFGYGLKLLSSRNVNFAPSDIIVDQESGIAITNAGYYSEFKILDTGGYARFVGDRLIPDVLAAATIDIQNPVDPIVVGGASFFNNDD